MFSFIQNGSLTLNLVKLTRNIRSARGPVYKDDKNESSYKTSNYEKPPPKKSQNKNFEFDYEGQNSEKRFPPKNREKKNTTSYQGFENRESSFQPRGDKKFGSSYQGFESRKNSFEPRGDKKFGSSYQGFESRKNSFEPKGDKKFGSSYQGFESRNNSFKPRGENSYQKPYKPKNDRPPFQRNFDQERNYQKPYYERDNDINRKSNSFEPRNREFNKFERKPSPYREPQEPHFKGSMNKQPKYAESMHEHKKPKDWDDHDITAMIESAKARLEKVKINTPFKDREPSSAKNKKKNTILESSLIASHSIKCDTISSDDKSFHVRVDLRDSRPVCTDKKFSEIQSNTDVLEFLQAQNYEYPTEVQASSYHRLNRRSNVYICSNSGTGKTIAYLVPMVLHVKTIEISDEGNNEPIADENTTSSLSEDDYYSGIVQNSLNPVCVIIVPNSLLLEQLMVTCNEVKKYIKIKVANFLSINDLKTKPKCHIALSTPGRFLDLMKLGKINIQSVKHVVIDEADMILKENTNEFIAEISKFNNRGIIQTQFVFTSANLPDPEIFLSLGRCVDKLGLIKCSDQKLSYSTLYSFHKVLQRNKLDLLMKHLPILMNQKRKILIFTLNLKCCEFLHLYLENKGIPNIKIHGSVKNIKSALYKFITSVPIAVCTDYMSRGVDIKVDTVVNFDFPINLTSFYHRAGRTGRPLLEYDNPPLVLSYMTKNIDVISARTIERSLKTDQELVLRYHYS